MNQHLGRISAFLKWAEAHGYASSNPVRDVMLKVKGGAAQDEREAIDAEVLRAFLRTQDGVVCSTG